MNRRSIFVALIALGGWSAVSAQDAGAPFACPKDGTVIERSSGSTWTSTARDGWVCSYKPSDGNAFGRFGHFVGADWSLRHTAGHQIQSVWPLKVGNEAKISTSDASLTRNLNIEVKEKIKLKVPAGEFEVYLIEVNNSTKSMRGGTTFDVIYRYFYAPSVGTYIKYNYDIKTGTLSNPARPWEATKITVP